MKNFAQAYVIIHCEVDDYNVLRSLSQIPEIVEGGILVGIYEVICKVAAPTYNDIEDVVTKKIRKLKDVNSTMTLNVIPYKGNN